MSNQNEMLDFVAEMHQQFNKHGVVMKAADGRLAVSDYKGFKETYAALPNADLIEIVQSQHVKINEIAYDREQAWETTMNIMRDVSNCKDFVAFDDLRKKARSLLLAQDMINRGASKEEVKKMLDGERPIATSNIIVQ